MRAWSGIVWRGAALGAALTVVALTIGSPAWADDASLHLADGGDSGLLGPFNVKTADGLRLDKYELTGGGDGVEDTTMRFLMSGLFALSRTIVGACCWLVDWVYRYPVLEKLIAPAQAVSDAYQEHVVEPLGIAPLFLAWAFAVGLIMVMRGRPGRGFGEIGLTLLISAMTASVLVRPDVLLGYDGPVQQVQRASLEAAVITANSGRETGDRDDPCDLVAGPAQRACRDKQPADDRDAEEVERAKRRQDCEAVSGPARDLCLSGKRAPAAKDVSEPITRILTDVLVVQPHQLLQFGQLFERGTSIHRDYVKGLDYKFTRDEDDPCRDLGGVAEEYCPNSDGISPEEFEDGKAQSELMEKHGEAGKVAIRYMNSLSWDRVLGALFLLIAVCVLALVVLSMAVVMLATQFSAAVAAAVGCLVLAWAILPGPNRGVLWKWLGLFMTTSVIMFALSISIPMFGIAAQALLTDTDNTVLVERLLLLDGLAITLLAVHRRILRGASGLGQQFALRMRYAKVGGTHLVGDQAAATGAALSSLGAGARFPGAWPGGRVAGPGPGGFPVQAALMNRRARLTGGLRSLGEGLPGDPAGLLADARAEGRRGLALLSVPLRAAHHAWAGKPRPGSGPRELGKGKPSAHDRGGTSLIVDGRTGEIIGGADREQNEGVESIGTRLHDRLSRTRGGRMVSRAGRLVWHSTVGLPAAVARAPQKKTELTHRLDRRLRHYEDIADRWEQDTRAGLQRMSAPVRRAYHGVTRPIRDAHRMRRWMDLWLDENGRSLKYGARPDDGDGET